MDKGDMYTTTNMLHQSKSVGRLPVQREINELPPRPSRQANQLRTNMTTIESDLGKNINQIYKEKIGGRQKNKLSASLNNSTFDRSNGQKQLPIAGELRPAGKPSPLRLIKVDNLGTRNQTLERCVTAPTLMTVEQVDQKENLALDEPHNRASPKKLCKQRSD